MRRRLNHCKPVTLEEPIPVQAQVSTKEALVNAASDIFDIILKRFEDGDGDGDGN